MEYIPVKGSQRVNGNRFLQDLTCQSNDPLIRSVGDMWNYKNTHRGALDQIPHNDQQEMTADNWYQQGRDDFRQDVDLREPYLNDEASRAVSMVFAGFGSYNNMVESKQLKESEDDNEDVSRELVARGNRVWSMIKSDFGPDYFLDDVQGPDASYEEFVGIIVVGSKHSEAQIISPFALATTLKRIDATLMGTSVRAGNAKAFLRIGFAK